MKTKLLFESYKNVQMFLDLTRYFEEATDDDIRAVLAEEIFEVEDEQRVLDSADSVMRKQLALVRNSGILERLDPYRAQSEAEKFGVEVGVRGERIRFPQDRKEAKPLLNFLLERYYEGPITGDRYATNSQRRL